MRNKIFFLLAVFTYTLVGCDTVEFPTAGFSVLNTDINMGEAIYFANKSENATFYQWDFGDDYYSFDENPNHVYKQAGTFEVSLVAINGSYTDTTTTTLTVNQNYEISIYEGTGVDNVQVWDTWETLKTMYSGDTLLYSSYMPDYDMFLNTVYYYDEGLAFTMISVSGKVINDDYVYVIYILDPYSGATAEGFGLGSTLSDVLDHYGTPDDTYTETGYTVYYYDTQGIAFATNNNISVSEIQVYPIITDDNSQMATLTRAKIQPSKIVKH